MARAKVELDNAGMRELLRSAAVRADLRRRGDRVRARAQATAPVLTGEFAGSFAVTEHTERDRAVVRVETTDPKGAIKEARHRTLTRALDAAR